MCRGKSTVDLRSGRCLFVAGGHHIPISARHRMVQCSTDRRLGVELSPASSAHIRPRSPRRRPREHPGRDRPARSRRGGKGEREERSSLWIVPATLATVGAEREAGALAVVVLDGKVAQIHRALASRVVSGCHQAIGRCRELASNADRPCHTARHRGHRRSCCRSSCHPVKPAICGTGRKRRRFAGDGVGRNESNDPTDQPAPTTAGVEML